ncbi:hypothetical protein E6H36_12665 [Candidatus Bathyarchaeota archaeon]|nr:MAG: hypothetical protein E6H36_12665 [Candidatus Bathyarchaeota archaeon]
MAKTVSDETVRLPRSMMIDLYDVSVRFASVLETLEVLTDKSTMKRIRTGERQYSKRQYVVAKVSSETRKVLSS